VSSYTPGSLPCDGAFHGGFCIPGQIMSLALLQKTGPLQPGHRTALKITVPVRGYPSIENAIQRGGLLRTGSR